MGFLLHGSGDNSPRQSKKPRLNLIYEQPSVKLEKQSNSLQDKLSKLQGQTKKELAGIEIPQLELWNTQHQLTTNIGNFRTEWRKEVEKFRTTRLVKESFIFMTEDYRKRLDFTKEDLNELQTSLTGAGCALEDRTF